MCWLLALTAAWAGAWAAVEGASKLPAAVRPTHYELHYVFDVDPVSNFSYFGVVVIEISVHESTSTIILHVDEHLLISQKDVTLKSNAEIAPSITSHDFEKEKDFLTFVLDGMLQPGVAYTLTVPFSSSVRDDLFGIYASNYFNRRTNETEYILVTQFETAAARKAFPCFDEPMMKATFQITIGHHRDFNAISNMPLQSSTDEKKPKSQFIWDRFERSVRMSTYLVAMVVSKLKHRESLNELKTKFRTYTRKAALEQTEYASIIGPKILKYFEEYFDIPFPLPKLDLVAIPDFWSSAMENWGLITYRENALLYDPKESTMNNKHRVTVSVAHETAHQWFGNLVTMKWWSDLWLNEGFANFMQEEGVDAVQPKWNIKLADRLLATLNVLQFDALESSHPIELRVKDPKKMTEFFDTISYEKGSAVIRMMSKFLGEEVFRAGVRRYLKKYSYRNAEQDDLWAEMTAAGAGRGVLPPGAGVRDVMATWITQPGFPLLTATRDYTSGAVAVTQSRYFSLENKSSSVNWWVPMSTLGENHSKQSIQWLSNTEGVNGYAKEFQTNVTAKEWFLLNPDMMAAVRVQYDARNWRLLAATLRAGAGAGAARRAVPLAARVQLISDACEFAATGRLDYELALQIVSSIKHEHEYAPLSAAFKILSQFNDLLKGTPSYGTFQDFVRSLVADTYTKLGGLKVKMVSEDLNYLNAQVLINEWACRVKLASCVDAAVELYRRWMESSAPDHNNPIPLDSRPTVYCAALSRGGGAEWQFAMRRRRRAELAAERQQLLNALSCTRDAWLMRELLELTIANTTKLHVDEVVDTFQNMLTSDNGYYATKDFMYQHVEDLARVLQKQDMGRVYVNLFDQFTTQKDLDEFEAWFSKNTDYFAESMSFIERGRETARNNIAWMNKHYENVVWIMKKLSPMNNNDPADHGADRSEHMHGQHKRKKICTSRSRSWFKNWLYKLKRSFRYITSHFFKTKHFRADVENC